MTALVGMAFGAVAGLGVMVAVWGATRGPALPRPRRQDLDAERLLLRLAAGTGAGLVAYVATGWPVGAILAAAAAGLIPSVLGAKQRRAAGIARTEAIATWAEMLRDTMASSAGLQESITVSARVAPAPIAAGVHRLASEMERGALVPALRRFADTIDDPAADIVVAALVVAAERQARNLGEVLGAAAASARATATMRMRVETGRARTYTASRLIVAITLTMTGALVVLDRGYLRPFDSAGGQLVLLVIGGVFAAGIWSLSRLSGMSGPGRVLTSVVR